MSSSSPHPPTDHANHIRLCISLSETAPLSPTNYRVGCLLFNPTTNTVLSTGYTNEFEGNTHAEENALRKFFMENNIPDEDRIGNVLPRDVVLYTTLEPCVRRLSGKKSCVERILGTLVDGHDGKKGVRKIFVGLKEPDRFVKDNDGLDILRRARVECIVLEGFEEEIKKIAMAGHTSIET